MMDALLELPDRIARWVGSLPLPALAGVGLLVLAGVAAGGYYAYETYDYVQHDNDFCISCHLMEEPYEEFAESAHRGLGCKACHQPTLVARSEMALAQIIENPEEIRVHAEVPNRVCADCHIEGDPEEWTRVANTAGHRVHLESTDPSLDGLQCVECHSTSVHEFAATDRTCAQSGCHTDNEIRLGGMGQLTIHCAACHSFSRPVVQEADQATALAALAPERSECLSCHVMRGLVDLPEDDPHEGACAACHNPHTQETPEAAVESCATAGYHTEPDTLSPFHRGMGPGVLEDCSNCHQAHDFGVQSTDCLSCHQDIFEDDEPRVIAEGPSIDDARHLPSDALHAAARREAPSTAGAVPPGRIAGEAGFGAAEPAPPGMDVWWAHAAGVQAAGRAAGRTASLAQEAVVFRHAEHRDVECTSCHTTENVHGAVTVTGITDCRSCHHTEPVRTRCADCHAEGAQAAGPYSLTRTLSFSVGDPVRRALPFDHETHEEEDCAECHTAGLDLSATQVDCASCHEEHHEVENQCSSCHVEAPASAHPPDQAHLTCSGSGCHQEADLPFQGVPTTRNACLVCHQDQVEHRVGQGCAECHALDGSQGEAP